MSEARTRAWIFLSVNEAPCTLQDIIGTADAINHAIPSHSELQTSLGWLNQQDLVHKEGKKYSLTKLGGALRQRVSAQTILKTWDNATELLSSIDGGSRADEDVTPQEVSKAYQGYKKWFWGEYRKLSTKTGNK
jgi:hypothetical protein